MTTSVVAQETEIASESDATVDATVDATAKVEHSPLGFVQKLVASDADGRFVMLPQVSPRGADKEAQAEMVKLLIGQLKSDYPDIRGRAAKAIGLFREDAKAAIPALLELIGDREQLLTLEPVWKYASLALASIGTESIEPVMAKIPESNFVEFYGLAGVISELGHTADAKKTAPVFVDLMKNGPDERRRPCMYCLAKLGDAAKPAIPEFIKELEFEPHKEFNRQVAACLALASLGTEAKAAFPKLVSLTEKNKVNMLSARTHAAMCLGAIGQVEGSGVDLVELFKEMIQEPNAFSQERGLKALGRLGTDAKTAGGFVAQLLEDEDFSQRPEAALTGWQITGEATPALETLAALIDNRTYDSRVYSALKVMGPAAAPIAERLCSKLDTDDESLKLTIAEIFVSMGAEGAKHVDKLRPLVETAPPDIAIELEDAIAELSGK